MKIAVLFDHKTPVGNLNKEGIVVYCNYLFRSWLTEDKSVHIEFWVYSFNEEALRLTFKDLFKDFSERLSIQTNSNHELSFKDKIINIKYKTKAVVTGNEKYLRKLRTNTSDFSVLEAELIENAQNSDAICVYAMHPALELGRYFPCVKIVQVHDLFTITLKKVFAQAHANIDEINSSVINNLQEYAKKQAVFITGTRYMLQTQLAKYITKAKMEQLMVIQYPPMLKNFLSDSILSETDIREKYSINGDYVPYFSQNRPNKNLIVLLKAIKILKDRKIDIKLVTTGQIASLKITQKFVIDNNLMDNIIELGYLQEREVFALYKYCKLAVVTTIIEGPGLPQQVLEPLSIGGIPVVCSNCMGAKESLAEVGVPLEDINLNWFDVDDSEQLANIIENVLVSPIAHINKQKNIINYYRKLNWSDVAKNYLSVIKEQASKIE